MVQYNNQSPLAMVGHRPRPIHISDSQLLSQDLSFRQRQQSPYKRPSPQSHSFQMPTWYGVQQSPMTMTPTGSPTGSQNRGSPRGRVASPRSGGYTLISVQDAKTLISTLIQSSNSFQKMRNEYIQQQRSSREGGKADVVNMEECLEVAGEKSSTFESSVRQLGIFDEDGGKDAFVMYKKVPRTALQAKSKQPASDEDLLAYLFSRWMQVHAPGVNLVSQKSNDRTFKMWRSVKYMNDHGIYCEMFVIASEFNRHLFHKEILE